MAFDAEILIIGCGNILFKDDGFGPAVTEALEEYFKEHELPDNVMILDAGTGGPHYIFQPLHELSETCEVMVIGCQPESVSAPNVELGLTKNVENAIPKAIKMILEEIGV